MNFNVLTCCIKHGFGIECQICGKLRHSSFSCWHCTNMQYVSVPKSEANFANSSSAEWLLDSGASTHLSNGASQIINPTPYHGTVQITVGNRNKVWINNEGKWILATPSHKLTLSKVLHVPTLSHNLFSVHKLTRDNNCSIIFYVNGYTIKDHQSSKFLWDQHWWTLSLSLQVYSIIHKLWLLNHGSNSSYLASMLGTPIFFHLTFI